MSNSFLAHLPAGLTEPRGWILIPVRPVAVGERCYGPTGDRAVYQALGPDLRQAVGYFGEVGEGDHGVIVLASIARPALIRPKRSKPLDKR